MNIPVPTRDQRRAVVLARWRLRRALLNAVKEVGKDIVHFCTCEYCRLHLLSDQLAEIAFVDRIKDVVKAILRNKSGHYLAHSHDDDKLVSYARGKLVKFLPERRTKTTLGRYIRRQYPDSGITDEQLESLCNLTMKQLRNCDDCFRVVSGGEIQQAYYDSIGGCSCMTGDDSDKVRIYAINPKVVKMLIYDDDDMTGRCLLWTTDQGVKVSDRIYPNGGKHIEHFNKWLDEHGYHRRSDNSAPSGQRFIGVNRSLTVTLRIPDEPIYPYMDSFWGYNSGDVDWDDNTITLHAFGGNYHLWSTDGCGPRSQRYCCNGCGCGLDEDDRYHAEGDYWCESCYTERFNTCNRCGETYRHDSLSNVHARYGDEEWCEYCRDNYATECSICGDRFRTGMIATVDDQCVCPSCRDENAGTCDACHSEHLLSNMIEVDDRWYCNGCEPEEVDDDESDADSEPVEQAEEVEAVA